MTASIFSVRLDIISNIPALKNRLEWLFDAPGAHAIFTPNPEILLRARKDASYASLLNSADLSVPDGIGISFIFRITKHLRIRRYAGIDVAEELCDIAARRGFPVLFLGGKRGSAIAAAERMTHRFASLRITAVGDNIAIDDTGIANSSEHETRIAQFIHRTGPGIIFVGFGAPKQEQWIARHKELFPSVRIMMTVGGAFDIWSGRLRRAPEFVRRAGLEWLWRFSQEPRRLKRILHATLFFPYYAIMDSISLRP